MSGPRFTRGGIAGPGRPRGTFGGRHRALVMLDRLLAERASLERLRDAFKAELERDPLGFWSKIIMPLLPREAIDFIERDLTGLVGIYDPAVGPRVWLPDNGRDGDQVAVWLPAKEAVPGAARVVQDSAADRLAYEARRPPLPPCHRRTPGDETGTHEREN
jgi:hypothetical protein